MILLDVHRNKSGFILLALLFLLLNSTANAAGAEDCNYRFEAGIIVVANKFNALVECLLNKIKEREREISVLRNKIEKSVDPAEVTKQLLANPDFLSSVKGKDGTPGKDGAPGKDADPAQVAQKLIQDRELIETLKGKILEDLPPETIWETQVQVRKYYPNGVLWGRGPKEDYFDFRFSQRYANPIVIPVLSDQSVNTATVNDDDLDWKIEVIQTNSTDARVRVSCSDGSAQVARLGVQIFVIGKPAD